MTRKYESGCATVILAEVYTYGKSSGWDGSSGDLEIIQSQLRKFNIVYVDDMKGEWAHRESWYEKLGRAVAQECGLKEGTPIEHQTGTVWVPNDEGRLLAISSMVTEELGD